MSHESTAPTEGQVPADPTAIDILEKNIRAVCRMSACLVTLSERLSLIEERLGARNAETFAGDPPDDDEDTHDHFDDGPPLAMLCDGRIAISAIEFGDTDISSRELWTGVILSESEASDTIDQLDEACIDAATIVGGSIIKRLKKGKG
jgi:hypothetical protein